MPGIEWITSFNYDPFVKGANAIKQAVSQMSSYIQKAGGDISNVFKQITDGGQTEEFERKANQIAKVFQGLVGSMGLAGDAADNAKDRINKALDDMVNSTERPKEKFRKFADDLSAIMNDIRATEAPIDNITSTGAIPAIEKRLKLEEDILSILEKQKSSAEQASQANAEGYKRNREALAALEEKLSKKYNGAAEGFYSDKDTEKLNKARESVENWAKAWDNSNTAVQACQALIDESNTRTEKMKQTVGELSNVYKGYADTVESTSSKIFISEEVFNRYKELSAEITRLKGEIDALGSNGYVDLPQLTALQDQLRADEEEFRALDGAARHTAEVLGTSLAQRVSAALENFYKLNADVRTTQDEIKSLNEQLIKVKQELTESKDPAAIIRAKEETDRLTQELDKANDRLSTLMGKQVDAMKEMRNLTNSVTEEESKLPDITAAVSEQVGGVMNKIAAFAGIGLGLNELKDFFSQAKEWREYFQDIESSMKVFLGSAEKGADFTAKLKDYAYYNMFEFSDLAAASQQMISYGHDVESIIPRLDQLSNVATGTHGSLMELVDAYNRAKATGVVDARGIQSWAVKGVMIKDVLREMGDTAGGTSVSFEQLNKVLDKVTGEGGQFHNLMLEMMDNISAEQGQLEDNLAAMFSEIGEKYEGVFVKFLKLQSAAAEGYGSIVSEDLLDWGAEKANAVMDDLLENWQKYIGYIKDAIAVYGSYRAALMITTAIQKAHTAWVTVATTAEKLNAQQALKNATAKGTETATEVANTNAKKANIGATTGQTVSNNVNTGSTITNTTAKSANTAATVLLTKATKALGLAQLATPWGIATAAIASLTYVAYKLWDSYTTLGEAQRMLNAGNEAFADSLKESKERADSNFAVLRDNTKTLAEQTQAYKDLTKAARIFAKYTPEELGKMSQEQFNNLWNMDSTAQIEKNKNAQLEALQEIQQWYDEHWFVGQDPFKLKEQIEQIGKAKGLMPEIINQWKDSVDWGTFTGHWINTNLSAASSDVEEMLRSSAENGIAEGLRKGMENPELRGETTAVVEGIKDGYKEINDIENERFRIEKEISDTQEKMRGKLSTSQEYKSLAQHLARLKGQLDDIPNRAEAAREKLEETYGEKLKTMLKAATDEYEKLNKELANAPDNKKKEIQQKVTIAADNMNVLKGLMHLMEVGKTDVDYVINITENAEDAILGDEKLVEIGKEYEEVDKKADDYKRKVTSIKEEMDSLGIASVSNAQEIAEKYGLTAENITKDFGSTRDSLAKYIEDLTEKRDALTEDDPKRNTINIEIARKQELLNYIDGVMSSLNNLASNPFIIRLDIVGEISDGIKGFLNKFGLGSLLSPSEKAKQKGKEAEERLEPEKTEPKKTGKEWEKEYAASRKARIAELKNLMNGEITAKEYEEYKRELDQLTKGSGKAAKQEADRRAKQIADELKYQEQMKKLRIEQERAQADAVIAAEENSYLREKKQRDEQHRRTLEDLYDETEIYKEIYNQRKTDYENSHKRLKYENTAAGEAGYLTEEAQAAIRKSLTDKEQEKYYARRSVREAKAEKENAEYSRSETERMQEQRIKSMREFLIEYGDFEEQRLAIAEKYAKQIEQANIENDPYKAAMLEDQRDKEISSKRLETIKTTMDWEGLFNNLDRYSVEFLRDIRERLTALMRDPALQPEDTCWLTDWKS